MTNRLDRELMDQLAAIRKTKRIKQSTVARRMHTAASSISHLENHRHPSLETTLRYAAAIGVTIGIAGAADK